MFDFKKVFNSYKDGKTDLKDAKENLQLSTAILLLHIAKADEEVAEEEQKHIVKTLRKRFELSAQEADELLELSEKEIERSIDIWQFTNRINQDMEKENKLKILKYAWEIIYTDDKLDPQEDYLIHKLANLLRLSHKELIKTKLKVKKS